MKALTRIGAKQEELAVEVQIMSVQAKVKDLTSLTVMWMRGSK
jgi:hypothetical protein